MAAKADLVARFNGGDNAGHTVTVGSQTFKLHLIPSGIIHSHTFGILGNGMVVNPVTFLKEIESLRAAGIEVGPKRLQISYAAHLITPGHKALDQALEMSRGKDQIGTTGRGIGPAYTDKTARRGLRAEDMLDPTSFKEKMVAHIETGQPYPGGPLPGRTVRSPGSCRGILRLCSYPGAIHQRYEHSR